MILCTTANARAQQAEAASLKFEVASIRQDPPDKYIPSNIPLSADDAYTHSGGLVSTHATLMNYIIFAYKVTDSSQYQLMSKQLPKWAQTESFDVEARADGNPTKDQMRVMMRALLEDRFKLAIHTETRQLPYYALELDKPGKTGPGLISHPEDGLCTTIMDKEAVKAMPRDKFRSCQPIWYNQKPLSSLHIDDFTMEQIAGSLGTLIVVLGRMDSLPVVDQTGLAGKFDFKIEFAWEPRKPPTADADTEPPPSGLTFTDALKAQAGLRMVKRTGPVTVYLIDHVEQPTEN
jgi:uncharacterized protein (TIGR03435 family)